MESRSPLCKGLIMKDFEEWLKDKYMFPEDARLWAWECWKDSRKATLEEVLSIPEDEELVGFVDRIEIQDMLEKLKDE